MALVWLDRQHVGKPDHDETGAWGDFDLNGKPDVIEQEAMLTAKYLLAAEIKLRELGHRVIVSGDGRYADRHVRANAAKADVYIAAHVNAGGGNYGLCLFDHRSTKGVLLAARITGRLMERCKPELKRAIAAATAPNNEWKRGFATIAGVYTGTPVGICFEPCFIDTLEHRPLLGNDGVVRIGYALAEGIHDWLSGT